MKTIDVISRDYFVKAAGKVKAIDVFEYFGQSDAVYLFGGKAINGISVTGSRFVLHLEHGNKVTVDSWFELPKWKLTGRKPLVFE